MLLEQGTHRALIWCVKLSLHSSAVLLDKFSMLAQFSVIDVIMNFKIQSFIHFYFILTFWVNVTC